MTVLSPVVEGYFVHALMTKMRMTTVYLWLLQGYTGSLCWYSSDCIDYNETFNEYLHIICQLFTFGVSITIFGL